MDTHGRTPCWLLILTPRHLLELEMSLVCGIAPRSYTERRTAKCIRSSGQLIACSEQLAL